MADENMFFIKNNTSNICNCKKGEFFININTLQIYHTLEDCYIQSEIPHIILK